MSDDPTMVEVQYHIDPITVAFPASVVEESYRRYYEDTLGKELADGEPDADQLHDWLANNMDWDDVVDLCDEVNDDAKHAHFPEIVAGPILQRERDHPDFDEGWMDAPKRVTNIDGDVLAGGADFEDL